MPEKKKQSLKIHLSMLFSCTYKITVLQKVHHGSFTVNTFEEFRPMLTIFTLHIDIRSIASRDIFILEILVFFLSSATLVIVIVIGHYNLVDKPDNPSASDVKTFESVAFSHS